MGDAKKLLFGILSILALWVGLVAYTSHQGGVIDEARQEAAKYRVLADEAGKDRDRLKAEATLLAQDRSELEERLKRLSRERPAAPAKPEPVPADSELASGLVEKGFSTGLTIAPVSFSTLTPLDAKLTWSWAAQAARVEGFEVKSAADEVFIATQSQLIDGLKVEQVNCEARNTLADKQLAGLKGESGELRKVVDGQVKIIAAEKYKTKLILGVSLPAAAWVGWKLGRR